MDISEKVALLVADLFFTHCDVEAAPETVALYSEAIITGQCSVDDVARQISDLGDIQKASTIQFEQKYGISRIPPPQPSAPSVNKSPAITQPHSKASNSHSSALPYQAPTDTNKPKPSPPPSGGTPIPKVTTKATSTNSPSSTAEYERLFETSFDPNPPGYSPKNEPSPSPNVTKTNATPIADAPHSTKDNKMDPEAVKQYVAELYRVYAGGKSDPATFKWHVDSIVNGNYTLNQAEMSIKFSKEAKEHREQEAQKKAALKPKLEEYVKELMRVYHKRTPTEEEINYYVEKMLQGTANFQQVEDEIVGKMSLPSVPKIDDP